MSNKDLIDLEAMSPRERAFYESLPEHEKPLFLGYGKFKRKDFDVPEFNRALWEKVYENGNAFITLGLDRPGMPDTGFGGKRASRCATIDLVAGRMGHHARKRDANTGEIKEWDNNFVADAARVYISQRSDPDGNFRIAKGSVGNTTMEEPRSTIVAKADTLRFVARENIKIVTRTDNLNSQGGHVSTLNKKFLGIDLMAANGAGGQQPLVKGERLAEYLGILTDMIQQLTSLVNTYASQTREFHQTILTHDHFTMFYGTLTAPDFEGVIPQGIRTLIDNVTNVEVGAATTQAAFNQLKIEYLEPTGVSFIDDFNEDLPGRQGTMGAKSILSSYNTTN